MVTGEHLAPATNRRPRNRNELGLLALVVAEVPVEDQVLALGVAGDPLAVAAELRVVRRQELQAGHRPLAELVDRCGGRRRRRGPPSAARPGRGTRPARVPAAGRPRALRVPSPCRPRRTRAPRRVELTGRVASGDREALLDTVAIHGRPTTLSPGWRSADSARAIRRRSIGLVVDRTITSPALIPASPRGADAVTSAPARRRRSSDSSAAARARVDVSTCTPRKAGLTALPGASSAMSALAVEIGDGEADVLGVAGDAIAVLMPITRPDALRSGPPELPGLIAASVWITSSSALRRSVEHRPVQGRDDARGHGRARPRARARCRSRRRRRRPRSCSELPSATVRELGASTFTTARSFGRSTPSTSPSPVVPSAKVTVILNAPPDDVVIRDDDAVGRDDEAGAGSVTAAALVDVDAHHGRLHLAQDRVDVALRDDHRRVPRGRQRRR